MILKMYDIEKNRLPPSEIATKSAMLCFWKCSAGHRFEKVAAEMAKNNECPVCKSLPVMFPELMDDWDFDRNEGIDPSDFSFGSGQKVWWKCNKGHSWTTAIASRTASGAGCQKCYHEQQSTQNIKAAAASGTSLQDASPEYLSSWDSDRNELTPEEVTLKSNSKVWWICSDHGSYQQTPASKHRGATCPGCTKITRAETVRMARLAKSGSLKDRF